MDEDIARPDRRAPEVTNRTPLVNEPDMRLDRKSRTFRRSTKRLPTLNYQAPAWAREVDRVHWVDKAGGHTDDWSLPQREDHVFQN